MIKKIDCKDLDCPMPVIKTKEAWESLDDDSILDIELNSISSIENVKRFCKKEGIYHTINKKTNNITTISLVKGYECELATKKSDKKLVALIIGSIVSAILASSCCLAPLLFLLFGVSMSSLTFLQIFAPYHNYFSIISILVLGYLWYDYLKNRKTKLLCETWLSKNYLSLLIGGSVFVLLFTTYPHWIDKVLE